MARRKIRIGMTRTTRTKTGWFSVKRRTSKSTWKTVQRIRPIKSR